jgi:hypothetical protein
MCGLNPVSRVAPLASLFLQNLSQLPLEWEDWIIVVETYEARVSVDRERWNGARVICGEVVKLKAPIYPVPGPRCPLPSTFLHH